MIAPFFVAKELAVKLAERRESNLENELSEIFRKLSKEHQLEIIFQLLEKNVRAAAAIAARGRICHAQQIVLLNFLLESRQTNALKVMISHLFARRLRASIFLRVLQEHCETYSESVFLASFYFLATAKMSARSRNLLENLRDATKPKLII